MIRLLFQNIDIKQKNERKNIIMFDNRKRKAERLKKYQFDEVSLRSYNCIIGAMLVYGFAFNLIFFGLLGDLVSTWNWIVIAIASLLLVIAGSIISTKSKKPILSFLGYNFILFADSMLISLIIPFYSIDQIILAFSITIGITLCMMTLSSIFPQFFSKLGLTLFFSLLIFVVIEIIAMLLGYRGDIFNWICVGIFSLYIGYDWHKAQNYPKTIDNAVDSTIDLYVDIINIFVRILDLLDSN